MSTLPEQFSAARNTQLEAQLDAFRKISSKAVENTRKLVALNLNTTRVSLEKSTETLRQLMLVRDPRDLFALTSQTQQNFDTMVAYSRALFGIASGATLELPQSTGPAPVPVAVTLEAAAPATPEKAAPAPRLAAVPSPAPVSDEAALAPEALGAKPAPGALEQAAPAAKAKPIAKAVGKTVAKEAPVKPVAAPVPEAAPVEVTGVKPVEAEPPPAPVSGKPVVATAKPPKKK